MLVEVAVDAGDAVAVAAQRVLDALGLLLVQRKHKHLVVRPLAARAGANAFVAGNAVFKGGPAGYADRIAAIRAGAGGDAVSC